MTALSEGNQKLIHIEENLLIWTALRALHRTTRRLFTKTPKVLLRPVGVESGSSSPFSLAADVSGVPRPPPQSLRADDSGGSHYFSLLYRLSSLSITLCVKLTSGDGWKHVHICGLIFKSPSQGIVKPFFFGIIALMVKDIKSFPHSAVQQFELGLEFSHFLIT